MTDLELQQLRREKWRLDGKPIRTIEQARAFLEDVGFCLMYPQRPPLLVPTFIGAFVGSDDRLPGWQHAFTGSAGGRGDRIDGAAAARTTGVRSESVRGEQRISGGGVGVSLFLCADGRAQSQAGAEGGIAVSLFRAGLRCV